MRKICFLFYYLGKIISVNLGLHNTAHPLSLKWRWQNWSKLDQQRREKKKKLKLNKSRMR